MRKSMIAPEIRKPFAGKLLTGVSAAALLAVSASVNAADAGQPLLWMEFGWHYELYSGRGDEFVPAFMLTTPRPSFEIVSPLSVQQMTIHSYGADGKFTFQPEDLGWSFSAAIRYGRAHGRKSMHLQPVTRAPKPHSPSGEYVTYSQLADAKAASSETHVIADFQAGKDIGLGLFGGEGESKLDFGVRFAQFNSQATDRIEESPDFHFYANPPKYLALFAVHDYVGTMLSKRSFQGLGPSIAWSGSVPVAGDTQDGEIAFDWGINTALLFGKQNTKTHHETTSDYFQLKYGGHHYGHTSADPSRRRTVIVPNLGGFAGLSFRYSDAKLSLGYRGDFFFGAIDGGIDVRHDTTRSFRGPFASISIGLGD